MEFPLWLSGLQTRCEDAGLIPGLPWWVKVWHCHKLWRRLQTRLRSEVALAVVLASAAASVWPLAQELPCAASAAIKKKKKAAKELSLRKQCYPHKIIYLGWLYHHTWHRRASKPSLWENNPLGWLGRKLILMKVMFIQKYFQWLCMLQGVKTKHFFFA